MDRVDLDNMYRLDWKRENDPDRYVNALAAEVIYQTDTLNKHWDTDSH